MRNSMIEIVPYSSSWPADFERLKAVYMQRLPSTVKAIEHVGSTAVPGLDAKPVLDIDIVVEDAGEIPGIINRLSELGYIHVGDRGIPGREAFEQLKETGPFGLDQQSWPRHNLYLCINGSASLRNHLLVREALRTDEGLRSKYAALKHQLAEAAGGDINAYVEGKSSFLTGILLQQGFAENELEVIIEQNRASDRYSPGRNIEQASPVDYVEVTAVWEASVRATHPFLKEEDLMFYKKLMLDQFLQSVDLHCVRDGLRIAGFIGTGPESIEMLFVHPDYMGRGIGKQLVLFAVSDKHVCQVDVNEQNGQAIAFYQKMGFRTVNRSEVDGMGKPYPILHLQLRPQV
ncbi:MAG: GNAT family N-acetyltransferase [Sphingobacteriales bacterium]|nr:MAG: GNAT family N-acetyltransferase [Sphingobacteriales bacterium]